MATITKNLSTVDLSSLPKGRGKKITLVVAEWNGEITSKLKQGAFDTLVGAGVYSRDVKIINVPGAFELPFAASQIIKNTEADAVICIGCVIRGETPHFDYVCQGVTNGIQQLNVTTNTPVIFCVLTDDNIQQSKDRSGGKHGNKGVEAAVTALKMIELNQKLQPTVD
jgi:6,7-dimethyl-8-ribityllumazine synthase